MTQLRKPISRRTLTKGAAWSAPVAVAGMAAPMAAATGCVPVVSFNGASSCKCSGQSTNSAWGYFLSICFDFTSCQGTANSTIMVTGVYSNTAGGTLLTNTPVEGFCTTLPTMPTSNGGSMVCTSPIKFASKNSANFIYVEYTIDGVAHTSPLIASPNQDCTAAQCAETDACVN